MDGLAELLETMDANIENDTESFTARKSAIDFLETISKHVREVPGVRILAIWCNEKKRYQDPKDSRLSLGSE